MSSPISGIDDSPQGKDMIDVINSYNSYIDSTNNNNSSAEISSNTELTSASDISAPTITGTAFPLTDVEVSNSTSCSTIASLDEQKTISSSEELSEGIKEAFIDSDGDGLPDNIDSTGKESQIEQAYDKECAERNASEESVRAFASIMSMLGNLDLTALSNSFQEGNSQSLSVQVAAGSAQVALTHTAQLQEIPNKSCANKEDIKSLMQKHQQQTKAMKVKNLQALSKLVHTRPVDSKRLESVPAKEKQQVLDNLSLLKQIIPS